MRLMPSVLTAFCIFNMLSVSAIAHAHLVKSSPAKASTLNQNAIPSQVSLEFSEDLEVKMCKVQVRSDSEAAADFTESVVSSPEGKKNVIEVKLKHPLPAGVYLVKWKVVAVDAHKMSGEYRFTVKPGAK